VYDFNSSIPADIDRTDDKAIAQYITSQIVGADEYKFGWHKTRTVNEYDVRGIPKYLASAKCLVFKCTQRQRKWARPDDIPLHKRRCKTKMQRVDCKGSLHVYFLRNCMFPPPLERAHDARPHIAFVYNHTPHEGRSAYGVPPILREWIRNNCGRTPYDTWEKMMSAVEAGEFAGLPENAYYSQRHVAYWHRKAQVQRFATISADSWVNMEALLKQDEKVNRFISI